MYSIGPTADIRDLIQVTGADETRIRVLVTGCVFLILLILLRRFVVSLYLIASVLFSFFATLGATFAFFWALEPDGFPGLDWKVSVLLFTALVAIGEDYNIFLLTRVQEEVARHGPLNAVPLALTRTGSLIVGFGLSVLNRRRTASGAMSARLASSAFVIPSASRRLSRALR
jgi:RND superfamily putative drug exporter